MVGASGVIANLIQLFVRPRLYAGLKGITLNINYMDPLLSKYKSAEKAVARELILKKLLDRYWNDAEFRN